MIFNALKSDMKYVIKLQCLQKVEIKNLYTLSFQIKSWATEEGKNELVHAPPITGTFHACHSRLWKVASIKLEYT